MAKVTNLSVHKNTVERRRKRKLAEDAKRGVENITRDNDVRAYAFVAIDAKGEAHVCWDTGAILPMWAFADTVAHILREGIRGSDVKEDWRPSLPLRGSTE